MADNRPSRERPHPDVVISQTSDGTRGRSRAESFQRMGSGKQKPSPPGLSRIRSIGRNERYGRLYPTQPPQHISPNRSAEGSQHLSPKRIDLAHARRPSLNFARLPPLTTVASSGEQTANDSQYDYVERSPDESGTTQAQFDTSSWTPITRPSSGAFGDNMYQYHELRKMDFRLVRLFATKMSTIKCQIIHESLISPPKYTAISYAWGDVDDKKEIQVNDITVPVTASLFGALQAVRERGEDKLVWVDALCINQQSRDERNQQVGLMTGIYAQAEEVAIWLGPEENNSNLAIEFLEELRSEQGFPDQISDLISSPNKEQAIRAMVLLFQRDYWNRLWVVQEVYNARVIKVLCGSTKLPWETYKMAADAFRYYKDDLDAYFSGDSSSPSAFDYAQALAYEGPNSLLASDSLKRLGADALLSVMRVCRRKHTSEPRDRVFGILGVLPENVRDEFIVDYSLSIKKIYTDVIDILLHATERLDCICEAIHFPRRTNTANLPSWLPDWSQNSEITALGYSFDFAAGGNSKARHQFLRNRNELEISAVYISSIQQHGVAVGTMCTLADYLMAFLNWRALLLGSVSRENSEIRRMEEAFCRTLSLGQFPKRWKGKPEDWVTTCYHEFASHLHKRLPQLQLDDNLRSYLDAGVKIKPNPRQFFQSNFGSRMMGRCLCITDDGDIGMGTGFMLPNDLVVVPFGCRTPIIIRKEKDNPGRYRFVGDVYVDGYMHGEAIKNWETGKTELHKFVLI
ncbi:heterokaryon incompatibility protein-domain-containing protein [Annulohypoxylon maeteangense]|uniref:heterokaryon incompatibility protein-domain-containing protein n=1 Tax=Annulohypoxylon maeteangense TaxID=1927788 RepID=UPI0020081212|nr:heterokaryon incompatibility protein-domain-containing protein [Annulohypoxylon maeteangense]KAI0880333.1 heterokaryon incompatibility protein-domain-containing protein [Annulohypoxylon maeteangense]